MEKSTIKICSFQFISLLILLFLLTGSSYPAFAGEVVLNPALSVELPLRQQGNPGDFLTYVLSFQNRSSKQVTLEIDFSAGPRWHIMGEPLVTIPANTSNYYYPITILIPNDAPAEKVEMIQLELKDLTTNQTLPPAYIEVAVNPVSVINISKPKPLQGLLGDILSYQITVTNNGNTAEQFSAKAVSQNAWKLEVTPANFRLLPGEFQTIHVKHHIPVNTDQTTDDIKLTIAWSSQIQTVSFQSGIVDKTDALKDQFYIWNGQWSLSHSDITESYRLNNSFSFQGQWAPKGWAQLYFSQLFDDANQNWFTDIRYHNWDFKTGAFWLDWPGLLKPETQAGMGLVTYADKNKHFSIYNWSTDSVYNNNPAGVEAVLNQTVLRYLYLPGYEETRHLFDVEYNHQLKPKLQSQLKFSQDLNNTSTYAYHIRLENFHNTWYWYTDYNRSHKYEDYLDKTKLVFHLSQFSSPDSITGHYQLSYENRLDNPNLDTDTFNLSINLYHPANYLFSFSGQLDYENQSRATTNTVMNVQSPKWQDGRKTHHWYFTFSTQDDPAFDSTQFTKLWWMTEYALNPESSLILKPTLADYSDSPSDAYSNLGLGYKYHWVYGPELLSMLYYYFNDTRPRWDLELNLEWRVYQYYLNLKYLGQWDDGYATDTLSFNLNRKFSTPVRKPLGTIKGHAFLDSNRNGIKDPDEPGVAKISFSLSAQTPFHTDNQGYFELSSLLPGDYRIQLDGQYQTIYNHQSVQSFVIKPYQILAIDIPLTPTSNITGVVYFDQNKNNQPDEAETGISGITMILSDPAGNEIHRTITTTDGSFIFFQTEPALYRVAVDPNLLPEIYALPDHYQPFELNLSHTEPANQPQFGLIAYEKPIEIISELNPLWLSAESQLVHPGDTLVFTIESTIPLQTLLLILPDRTEIPLPVEPSQGQWSYRWQIPLQIETGETLIQCRGTDRNNQTYQAETHLIITREPIQ